MNYYVMDPLADVAINWMPRWIAPNLITMFGFMCSLGPTVYLFKYHGTSFANDPERPIPKEWYII